jgi:hypothetical protein
LADGEPLEAVLRRIYEHLNEARGAGERGIDREVRWLTRLPTPVLRAAVRLSELAANWNVLPAALMKGDPMFPSIFLANLGSVALDGAYHHLYEHGTTSLFGVVGTVKKIMTLTAEGTPETRDSVTVRWTFDERIHDGFCCAESLELRRAFVENPARYVFVGSHKQQPAAQARVNAIGSGWDP